MPVSDSQSVSQFSQSVSQSVSAVSQSLSQLSVSQSVSQPVAGAILIRLFDVNKYYRLDDYEEVMLVYACAFLFFWFFIQLIFLVGTYQFYNHVKKIDRRSSVDDKRGLVDDRGP